MNDPFVMGAWGNAQGTGDKILMLADGNGEFTPGPPASSSTWPEVGLGTRSQRYAAILQDGVVQELFVETSPGGSTPARLTRCSKPCRTPFRRRRQEPGPVPAKPKGESVRIYTVRTERPTCRRWRTVDQLWEVEAAPEADGVPMAEWWRRFAALVIDTAILWIPLGFLTRSMDMRPLHRLHLSVAVGVTYFALLNGSRKGQTLGKMVWGVQVRDAATGGPLGLPQGRRALPRSDAPVLPFRSSASSSGWSTASGRSGTAAARRCTTSSRAAWW